MVSFLNTDFYKITMMQAVWQLFPNVWVKYRYKLRSKDVDLIPYLKRIQNRVDALQGLGPTQEEIEFLAKQGFLNPTFLAALKHFKLNPDEYVKIAEVDGQFFLEIEGPWYDTICFEVPLLQIISETYFEDRARENPDIFAEGRRRLDAKIEKLLDYHDKWWREANSSNVNPFCLMEFGTRRAFSSIWHDEVVAKLALRLPKDMLLGTSNVHLARTTNLKPQGTMAHEFICAHGALYPLHEAQKQAFYNWNKVYQGELGIALSDTYTFNQFLRDFDKGLANLFAGARHDSGDPFTWGTKLIQHYIYLNINPRTKVAVWSDGLNVDLSLRLHQRFAPSIRTTFGIGTDLSNDLGVAPLSQVIKLTQVNGMPVIKISDEPAKVMCEDEQFKNWAMHLFTELIPSQGTK